MKEIIKEVAINTVKEGVNKTLESFKEGQSFKEALKSGFDKFKETAFTEMQGLLSTESQNKLVETSENLDSIQENIEFSPENVNLEDATIEINKITENINEISNELKENVTQNALVEAKEFLNDFKDILDQAIEVKGKLQELGLDKNLLTMLNHAANEINDLNNDTEEIEEEGEGE